jgi:probable F420-dependent oxidoreductase
MAAAEAPMEMGLILVGGSARADLELAQRAEASGFASVFSIEFFNRHGYATLGAIAHATRRVRIGTAIANAFTRTPLLHASAAMDLDELSGGRMVLGLGSATRRMNEEWYDVRFSAPAARMQELVELLRAAFAAAKGGGLHFEGTFWNVNVPIYGRPGAVRETVPIWVAAVNRGMIAAAGTVADGLVGHPIATRAWHRDVTLPGLHAAERAAGRPRGACRLKPYVMTSLHPDPEQALRNAKGQIGFYFTTALYHTILDHHGLREVGVACRKALRSFDTRAMAEAVPDALVREIAIVGTPDDAREQLAGWKDLTDEPLLYPPSVGVSRDDMKRNLDLIFETFGARAP